MRFLQTISSNLLFRIGQLNIVFHMLYVDKTRQCTGLKITINTISFMTSKMKIDICHPGHLLRLSPSNLRYNVYNWLIFGNIDQSDYAFYNLGRFWAIREEKLSVGLKPLNDFMCNFISSAV